MRNRSTPSSFHLRCLSFHKLLLTAMAAAVPGLSLAAGLDLSEYGAASLGSAHSAGANYRADPSALRFNPAGIAHITTPQWVVDASLIRLRERFSNGEVTAFLEDAETGAVGTTDAFTGQNIPLGQPRILSGQSQQTKNPTGSAADFFLAAPIAPNLVAGFGLYVPYVFQNELDDDWVGRFSGTTMDLVSIAMHPVLAVKLSPSLSLGVGLPILYTKAKTTKSIDFGNESIVASAILNSTVPALEGSADIELDGFGVGLSAGLQWQINNAHRLGLSLVAPIDVDMDGSYTYKVPALYQSMADALNLEIFPTGPDASSTFNFPGKANISYEFQFLPKWKWNNDLAFTQWSRLEDFHVDVPAFASQSQVHRLRNTWRAATGVEYALTANTLLRAGLAYDRSAARSAEYRIVLGPEADRRILAAGIGYRLDEDKRLDVAVSYENWVKAKVNYTDTTSFPADYLFYSADQKYRTTGKWKASVMALAVQYTDTF